MRYALLFFVCWKLFLTRIASILMLTATFYYMPSALLTTRCFKIFWKIWLLFMYTWNIATICFVFLLGLLSSLLFFATRPLSIFRNNKPLNELSPSFSLRKYPRHQLWHTTNPYRLSELSRLWSIMSSTCSAVAFARRLNALWSNAITHAPLEQT